MALDQDLTPSNAKIAPVTGVENEIAAYRAIAPSAVVGLICGLLAIFCFTSWFFLAFTIAALAFGLRAERKIQRDPEIWTGRKLAQVGMTLGVIFGLAAVTNTVVQDFLRGSAAKQFASQYAGILTKGSLEDAAWYTASPLGRDGKTPAEVYKELTSSAPAGMPDDLLAALRSIKERLASNPGEQVVFERLERHGLDGMTPYAAVVFLLRGPGTEKTPEKEPRAIISFKNVIINGKSQWWIESSRFPYEPTTGIPTVTKAEGEGGGHGH